MRVILDECMPRLFARELTGHAVETVAAQGWAGIKNGKLLALIEGGFDAMITMDCSMPSQQSIAGRSFGLVVVRARSNRLAHLRPLAPDVLVALRALQAGHLVIVPTP